MTRRRVMSYEGHVIYASPIAGKGICYCFAKGDGTDNWYASLEAAKRAIDEIEEVKKARRAKNSEVQA